MANNIFINFSNHPHDKWTKEQLVASHVYGKIIDIPFPSVDPLFTEKEVSELSIRYANEIMSYSPSAVMCQGEFTLAYGIINYLLKNNIHVLAACSERVTFEKNDIKVSQFKFIKYREYIEISP